MSNMTTDETYNGYANRETWAFNLHWQNDQELYNTTLLVAGPYVTSQEDGNWRNVSPADDPFANTLALFREDVGSFWRVDVAEVGAAVRESLDAES